MFDEKIIKDGWFTWYGQDCQLLSFVLFDHEAGNRNCKKLLGKYYGAISPHNKAEQVLGTKVVVGLDVFDLGEDVDGEAIRLTSLSVATVQVVSTS